VNLRRKGKKRQGASLEKEKRGRILNNTEGGSEKMEGKEILAATATKVAKKV